MTQHPPADVTARRLGESVTNRDAILHAQARLMRLNTLLCVAWCGPFILAAALSGSMLLWTDTMDYARAVLVSLFAWRILRGVARGTLTGFDYGTDKVQSLMALAGAFAYLTALSVLGWGCLQRILDPVTLSPTYSRFGIGLQLLSIGSDLYLGTKSRGLSRQLCSPVLEVHWRTCFSSALITLAMMLGLLLTILLHNRSWSVYVDPACALLFIAYGVFTFLPTIAAEVETLADKTLKEEFQLRIDRRLVENFHGYSGFHGVRSRRSGGRLFIEIALSFPADMPAGECMKTINALRDGIGQDLPGSEVSVVLQDTTASGKAAMT